MRSYSSAAGLLAAAVLGLGASGVDGVLMADFSPFGEMAYGDFSPLGCNGAMNDGTFDNCVTWSSKSFNLANPVEIPCGECVDMDLAEGTELTLQGLDIQGALRFPNNWKGTITTPFVFVQGHLVIDNDAPVNGDNIDGLKFVLEGTADQSFSPNAENSAACRGSPCNVGKKPFVVAGGKVHINALPDTCPTWVPLLDVVENPAALTADVYPTPPSPVEGCSANIIDHDFANGNGPFQKSLGSEERVLQTSENGHTSPSLRTENRTKSWQGPFVDLVTSGLRDCVVADQTYLVHAKAKVTVENPTTNSSYSNCHVDGSDCLSLVLHTGHSRELEGDRNLKFRTVGQVAASQKHSDDEWFDFVAEFEFTAKELDESLYSMMYFAGPEAGVAVELADVKMQLPDASMFPDPNSGSMCNNLVVNGDAENGLHKFPFGFAGNLGSSVSIKSETVNGTSNNFFAVRGREESYASINIDLINDCIVRDSQYTFSARIRLHSAEESDVRMLLKTWSADTEEPTITESVGFGGVESCVGLSAAAGWYECSRQFQFKEEHETATKIELSFLVPDDWTSDIDFDDIKVELSAASLNQFVVNSNVATCWGAGATILQTSSTLSHENENVLTIDSVTDNGDGTAVITTTTSVAKPSTAADDANYAVEIALLDRNVKIMPIEPTDDSVNPLHGGHFTIAHTPDVAQTVKGVHMSKMGQQGNFGRYPIHLHMNKNIEGTEISRNLVSKSNQRCYVVHGTHGVKLEYNIAHDNFGHCFMLEDGIEQNNTFNYNLGSNTKVTPDEGILSIAESDMFPATFWISNPRNYFQGNVAAGSEDSGFWYEFLDKVRGFSVTLDPAHEVNPSSFPFGHFKENRFHSNQGEGFKLYPNGYFPDERAVLEGSIAIKNKGGGVLLHNSKNLGIDGGFYGDNRMQIEVDKQADDVTVTNAAVVGFSDLYKAESEAGGLASHCPADRPITGVQLHSFLRFRDSKGYHLENVAFSDFEESDGCVGTTAIEMDKELRDGHFDAFTSVKSLTFAAGAPMKEKFNMCDLAGQEAFIGDLAINDLDGSLHPQGASTPGFVVSDTPMMTAFLDESACKDMEGSCSLFCEGACYRTLNFAVPVAPEYDDMVMVVTDKATGNVARFPGYFEKKTKVVDGVEVEDVYENYNYQRRRYFSPIVPMGNYTLTFRKDGAYIWPMMAEKVWEDPPACEPYIDDNAVDFIIPEPTGDGCFNLIRNPDGEQGNFNYWMHSGGGLKLYEGGSSGSYAISSDGRTGAWQGPGQFLDMRCLSVGQKYEVTAKFKLVDSDGADVDCDPNQKDVTEDTVCPRISLRMRRLLGNNIGDGVEVNYAYPIGEAILPFKPGEWNNMYGVFHITETMANADSIFMFVERARPGVDIVIDDVLFQQAVQGCSNAIYNGDFESGDTRYWGAIGEAQIGITTGYNSDYALRTTQRNQFWSGMTHDINLDCLVVGEQYGITAMVKLLDENDALYSCDPAKVWGNIDGGADGMSNVCPTLAIRIVTGDQEIDEDIGEITTPGEWNSYNGLFTATEAMKQADTVTLFFTRYIAGKHLVIDDVVMSPINATDPAQLMSNGDCSSGDTRYFGVKDSGTLTAIQPGAGGASDYAFKVSGRTTSTSGIEQPIDNNYIEAGVMYKITADLKLETSGTPYDCDPSANAGDKACPIVYLKSKNAMEPPTQRPAASVQGTWVSGGWNKIEGYITFFPHEIGSESLMYFIAGAKSQVDMILDNIALTKTGFNAAELAASGGGGNATAVTS